MSNRKAVTKAQLNRVLDVLRDRGQNVSTVEVRDDGSVSLGLTNGSRVAVTSDKSAEDEWDRALGLQ